MMKLFKTLLVCLPICALLLSGCLGFPAVDSEPETTAALEIDPNEKSRLVTADELLAAAGLTAEELPGVDLYDFIVTERLTTSFLSQIPSDVLKEALLAQAVPETNSCSYLINGESITLAEGEALDIEQVKKIAVVSRNDALVPSLVIDLEAGKAYYSDGYFLDDMDSADKVTDLTDELRNEVITAVKASGVDSWETTYTDSAEPANTDENYYFAYTSWMIAFEIAEGVVRYSVYGVEPDAPQEFFDLGVCLYNLFW